MTIQYYRKSVYGNELIYLVDGEGTENILRLIGTKTISRGQMQRFTELGLKFVETFAPVISA